MTNTKSLFKISEDLLILMENLSNESEETGEISSESEALLVISQEELSTKVEGYRAVITNFTAENNAVDAEIARLTAWKDKNTSSIDRLKGALLQATLLFGVEDPKSGVKRLQLGLNKLSTRKSKSINILDKDEVSDQFKTIDVTVKVGAQDLEDVGKKLAAAGLQFKESAPIVSKTAIKAVIESGKKVSGAEQIEKFGLTIK